MRMVNLIEAKKPRRGEGKVMKKWIIDYLGGVVLLLALDYFFQGGIYIVFDLVVPLIVTTLFAFLKNRTAKEGAS